LFTALEKLDQFYCDTSTDFAPEIDPCLLIGGQEILKDPVCGSDKITYVSKSDLFCTAKKNPGIADFYIAAGGTFLLVCVVVSDLKLFHAGECV
jgi:hypothetical protein